MRVWLKLLFENPGAQDDFIDWARGIEKNITDKIQQSLLAAESTKAIGLAHELKAYQTIRQAFEAERRELQARLKRKE